MTVPQEKKRQRRSCRRKTAKMFQERIGNDVGDKASQQSKTKCKTSKRVQKSREGSKMLIPKAEQVDLRVQDVEIFVQSDQGRSSRNESAVRLCG
jgi:hypothetical protein